MTFLDFEQPIAELFEQLEKARALADSGQVDMNSAILELEKKIDSTRKDIYSKLTPWQRVQVSRHPDRPYTLAYINYMTDGNFIEMHGDRTVGDDKAMIGGLGCVNGKSVMFIGQQKGANTKMRQLRRFGMSNPEGYRKALRLMKLAEKFGIPVISLIDTPGAYPGLEAEERGQGEAIARNLFEMTKLRVPIVCVIIGEGASGGALGIGIGDKVLMLENTWYSVISPESCSSILWRSWEFKEKASTAMKLTASDMLGNKLIDGVIPEPIGGAHTNFNEIFKTVKTEIMKHIEKLSKIKPEKRIENRINKFSKMGSIIED
jgi:acetyl-CoA carboxylase carboxyl transferase subunit alpha